MRGLFGLCRSKGDKSDDTQDTPARPVQQAPRRDDQTVSANFRTNTSSRDSINSKKGDKRDKAQDTPAQLAQQDPGRGNGTGSASFKNDTSSTDSNANKLARRDLWKEAFDGLNASHQKYLPANSLPATDAISGVIHDTTAKYEEWKKGGLKIQRQNEDDMNVRDSVEKIIGAAMKAQEIISQLVSFDPTGHGRSQ